ncbi:hypothetical protein Bca52824_032421 [Brassica carinata]|uniref:Uncharacterized protein n=1 Tax=Brassica carinata TaxID=52824 RepID=A0A8X7SC15_BRACI|nr:hypothetical protein Bca52824_032421 [Brassica carinata]
MGPWQGQGAMKTRPCMDVWVVLVFDWFVDGRISPFLKASVKVASMINMLKRETGKDDIAAGSIRRNILHAFSEDESPKVNDV